VCDHCLLALAEERHRDPLQRPAAPSIEKRPCARGFGFADRLPYRMPIAGLYSCSAGTHPAGSVIGCAGHNAAMCILGDLGRR
jgi:phytoene dehydrogenase-like protein